MHTPLRTLVAALATLIAACGPSASQGADGMVTTDPCNNPGEARCVGASHQVCENGVYVEDQACSGDQGECDPTLGCVACRPNNPRTCVGDEVHTCNDDGTVGGLIETCDFEQCSNGSCGGTGDCDTAGVKIIYVVDDSYRLWSFDPALLPSDPFHLIGNLNCPAGASLPGWDPLQGAATPFSMSVDREARAWVLYTSGEIFYVSTTDASCTATGFTVGQQGFELFGMGFVSDSQGSSDETLFISGGAADQPDSGDLGTINKTSLAVNRVNSLPTATYSPELTGTGAAELYGYYPGTTSFVAKINKTTAQNDQTWSLPGLSGTVRAWAFAHWGGEFFIFITTNDGLTDTANVLRLDPAGNSGAGTVTTPLTNTGKIVVGAGVSTCAPIVVP